MEKIFVSTTHRKTQPQKIYKKQLIKTKHFLFFVQLFPCFHFSEREIWENPKYFPWISPVSTLEPKFLASGVETILSKFCKLLFGDSRLSQPYWGGGSRINWNSLDYTLVFVRSEKIKLSFCLKPQKLANFASR